MRFPTFLPTNGTIGFIAPSFGCATEPYKSAFISAQDSFRSLGYKLITGPNCYAAEGLGISNTPKKCAKELNEAYKDHETDCLITCGGGELMCEVVPHIDFAGIASSKPKWYMGYSDNTNFTFLSATLADTAAIYAPCAPAFGMKPWHTALNDAMNVISGLAFKDGYAEFHGYDRWEIHGLKDEEHPLLPYNTTIEREIISLPDGCFDTYREAKIDMGPEEEDIEYYKPVSTGDICMSGRLIGGCADCLKALVGTSYDKVSEFAEKYKDDGILWFMEACDLSPLDLRRTLWQLREAGWFKHASGFIFGRPYRYGENALGVDMYNAVTGILSDLHLPVLMDADLGHHPPMIPLVCGSYATVTTSKNDYTIKMELK